MIGTEGGREGAMRLSLFSAALVAALVGLAIVAQVWEGLTLDPLGVAFAVGAAVALAIYYITADMQVFADEFVAKVAEQYSS